MAGTAQAHSAGRVLGGQCLQKQPSVTDGSCPLESEGCPVQSSGSPRRESRALSAEGRNQSLVYTVFIYCESRCPETGPISRALIIASGHSLFRAGGSKWPVTPVQLSHGPESSGGRKWLCLWKTHHHLPPSVPALGRLCRQSRGCLWSP